MTTERASFLRDFVSLGTGTEIPSLFMLWGGIAGVSAVLERRCWVDMGYIVYPNLYIVLVAGAGRCRKSTAIDLIEPIVRAVEPPIRILSQIYSGKESLIQTLKSPMREDKTVLLRPATGFAFIDELINFLNRKNYEAGFGGLLISLFDCKDRYEYETLQRGKECLHKTCLGLIGATTVDWLRLAVPIEAIGGGLVSRIVMVYVDTPNPPVDWPESLSTKRELIERMIRSLTRIRMLEGEVTVTPAARGVHKVIYNDFYHNSLLFADSTTTAYASRRHVHLMKLAIILAASEESLCIDDRHLLGANEALKQTEAALPSLMGMVTSSEKGILLALIKGHVMRNKRITRTALLQAVSHRIDSRELTDLMDTLIHAKQVRCVSTGGTIYYEVMG